MQWKKWAYQNRWTKALCLYYYCVLNFIKVSFINAFHFFFWCFLFWVRSWTLNNHFPDLWKPLMNLSLFSFQVKNTKKKWKAFNSENSTVIRRKHLPYMNPLNFWNFASSMVHCLNFVLACMTSSRHSEDRILLTRKCTVILYQLCFLQEDNGLF